MWELKKSTTQQFHYDKDWITVNLSVDTKTQAVILIEILEQAIVDVKEFISKQSA